MTQAEIERADEAACKLDGMFRDIFNQEDRRDLIKVIVAAVDAHRSEEKRKHCRHYNKTGTGSLSSDGSSSFSWFCPECGTRDYTSPAVSRPHHSTPVSGGASK